MTGRAAATTDGASSLDQGCLGGKSTAGHIPDRVRCDGQDVHKADRYHPGGYTFCQAVSGNFVGPSGGMMRRLTVRRSGKTAFFLAECCCAGIVFGGYFSPMTSDASERLVAVISGTYGHNCGAHRGNATRDLSSKCNGRETCDYVLDPRIAADLDAGNHCSKDFVAEWQCDGQESHMAMLSPEAGEGSTLVLTCVEPTGAGK